MVPLFAILLLAIFEGSHIVRAQLGDSRNIARPLPLFDVHDCNNACELDEDCPPLANCRPIVTNGKSCGVCICTDGFNVDQGKCVERAVNVTDVPVDSITKSNEEMKKTDEELNAIMKTEEDLSNITAEAVSTADWDCSKFDCETIFTDKENDDPLLFKTSQIQPLGQNNCTDTSLFAAPTTCSHLVGGKQCAGGGSCLSVEDKVDYCICPYQRSGTSCHIEKEGKCKETTGKLPAIVQTDRRYVHKINRHVGSIVARHFAPSLEHCIRLCEWTGPQRCLSVNFGGQFNGQSVCELLSVWASPDSALQSWIQAAPGWTYACCF